MRHSLLFHLDITCSLWSNSNSVVFSFDVWVHLPVFWSFHRYVWMNDNFTLYCATHRSAVCTSNLFSITTTNLIYKSNLFLTATAHVSNYYFRKYIFVLYGRPDRSQKNTGVAILVSNSYLYPASKMIDSSFLLFAELLKTTIRIN